MKRYFQIQSAFQPTFVRWLHNQNDVPQFVVTFVNSIRFLLENEGFTMLTWSFPDCRLYIRKDFGNKYLCRIDKF